MVDNEYYNREALHWWSGSDCPLMMIRYTMNPIRLAYVKRHLASRGIDCRGKRVLDIGCGGGFLTEEIAKYGMDAVGLDPSAPSLDAARRHAEERNIQVQYLQGVGENLPFSDREFDIIFCCDVLEHVADFEMVVGEITRVLKPGGLLFFETVNRTLLSFFVVIFLMQEWRLTQVIPRNVHSWDNFIKPDELTGSLSARGLAVHDIRGILPGWNFLYNFMLLRRKVKNKIGFEELCRLFRCHESVYRGLCYVGYAVKKEAA